MNIVSAAVRKLTGKVRNDMDDIQMVIKLPEEVYRAYEMDPNLSFLNADQKNIAKWYLINALLTGKSFVPQQKIGHWILTNRNGVNKYVCSECDNEPLLIGESYSIFKLSDYCPYCGVKMEVKE